MRANFIYKIYTNQKYAKQSGEKKCLKKSFGVACAD